MTVLLDPETAALDETSAPIDPEALIEEARQRQRRRRRALASLFVGTFALCIGLFFALDRHSRTNAAGRGRPAGRLCVRNRPGWHARFDTRPGVAPTLVLTNFHFGRMQYLYGHTDARLRWPAGGVLISIADWTRAATTAMKREYAQRPLQIATNDFHAFEGVSNLGQQQVSYSKHLLELWVQARPTTAATIRAANNELSGVRLCG